MSAWRNPETPRDRLVSAAINIAVSLDTDKDMSDLTRRDLHNALNRVNEVLAVVFGQSPILPESTK